MLAKSLIFIVAKNLLQSYFLGSLTFKFIKVLFHDIHVILKAYNQQINLTAEPVRVNVIVFNYVILTIIVVLI